MIKSPAKSTVHAVLDRHGLVKRRKRRRYKTQGTTLTESHYPNGLWCADYKCEAVFDCNNSSRYSEWFLSVAHFLLRDTMRSP